MKDLVLLLADDSRTGRSEKEEALLPKCDPPGVYSKLSTLFRCKNLSNILPFLSMSSGFAVHPIVQNTEEFPSAESELGLDPLLHAQVLVTDGCLVDM